ncbi:Signal recognition particle protein, partial [Haemophilus influenzae]
RFTRCG